MYTSLLSFIINIYFNFLLFVSINSLPYFVVAIFIEKKKIRMYASACLLGWHKTFTYLKITNIKTYFFISK